MSPALVILFLGVITGALGIRNGDLAKIEDHPYVVILELNNAIIKLCTGVIVSDRYIITKEVCAHVADSNGGLVRAGSNLRGHGGSEHSIDKAIYPPGYPEVRRIALLRVNEPFQFDRSRQPIELFESNEIIQAGTKGIVAGLGEDETGEARRLHTVSFVTTTQEFCETTFKDSGFYEPGVMCAQNNQNKAKDVCSGDSGAPFVVGGRLAGIVMLTWYKCEGKEPALLSNVTDFSDWIYEQVGHPPKPVKVGDEPSVILIR
ncbi:hypothetical protein QAD02_023600 [Eretmocerus hayati]|uniref:Uncharacterized protein n=1 Tax=Eretmocerus hayati TaxID=131215 RepID=A0ACC2PYF1_9HYME|nr:hypothetical protein QAD02_023600 [Eretmocerus hayati]